MLRTANAPRPTPKPAPPINEVGTRKVNPGGYVWWKSETWTVENDALEHLTGRSVHVVEFGGVVYIGIGDDMSAELFPASRCRVTATVEVE